MSTDPESSQYPIEDADASTPPEAEVTDPTSGPEDVDVDAITESLAGDADGADGTEALRLELQETRDQLLRAQAELLNSQKRIRAQFDEQLRYANTKLGRDLLDVIDNFERAVAHAPDDPAIHGFVQGIAMTQRQLIEALSTHGIRPIEAVGQPFDPSRHEAVMQQPSAEHPEGTVLQDVSRGYMLHDRVLRAAKVILAAAPTETVNDRDASQNTDPPPKD